MIWEHDIHFSKKDVKKSISTDIQSSSAYVRSITFVRLSIGIMGIMVLRTVYG